MPEVVHTYLQKTNINKKIGGQPPGFADYLRGTIALYQFSKKYNYTVKFDINSHPIFKHLNIPDNLITNINYDTTFELLPPYSYNQMPYILDAFFGSGANFSILTNCFYQEKENMADEYNFAKSFLIPSVHVTKLIQNMKNNINMNFDEPYCIIHARLGDAYLVDKHTIDNKLLTKIRDYITEIKHECNMNVLLLADSKQLKDKVNDLCYVTHSDPIHTGSLDKELVEEKLGMVICEFFLMSKASKIYCINFWDGSGYSRMCSKIYSIPYHTIKL